MKKRIDVIAGEESYNNLSTFNDVEEMNKTVRVYRDVIKTSVKRADVQSRLIALLNLLKEYSCKYVGVSFLYKNTIAEIMGVSYKTVQRLVKKLEELGMIRQVAMKSKRKKINKMLQTANAIIISPAKVEKSDKKPVKKSEKCPTSKTTSPSLKQKIKRLNKRNNSVPSTNQSAANFSKANFVAHWVPEQFTNLTSYYYNDAKTIQEMWKVVKQNNRVINHVDGTRAFNKDQELTVGIQAFKEFVMKVKGEKKINNIFGYFNGIVNNLMDKLFFDVDFD